MKKNQLWKLIIITAAIGISLFQLSFSYRYYSLPREERYLPQNASLRMRSVKLGLDLEGGSHFLLAVDTTGEGGPDMVNQVVEILRSRVDKYGVSEPIIEVQGKNNIVIELPGEMDPTIAKKLIGTTATLDFRVVKRTEELRIIIDRIDRENEGKFSALLKTFPGGYSVICRADDWKMLDSMVISARENGIADSASGKILLWSVVEEGKDHGIPDYRELLLVSSVPEILGASIVSARAALGTSNSQTEPRVDLEIGGMARADWARVTSDNIGNRIAIVLDGEIFSAPVVNSASTTGKSTITLGRGTLDDAKALASVLQAGRMPARADIEESFVIGPSLGADSIKTGIRSLLIAAAVIMLIMLVYYRLSGLVANFALILNMLFLLAILSAFNLTLTLPGIAGLVLVIGTAVDANVLIFERIREELVQNKSVKKAVDTGFSKAFITILDANVTTLLSALILWWFGKGPIRGFAVTLSVGLIANVFTAVFISRFVFDNLLTKANSQKLSI
ncbi:protein translocase subunit SecD [candidate division WOR-3 bacterium]|nr:protein translocase subunit SecD [candidate division WOR-3 bacterium]